MFVSSCVTSRSRRMYGKSSKKKTNENSSINNRWLIENLLQIKLYSVGLCYAVKLNFIFLYFLLLLCCSRIDNALICTQNCSTRYAENILLYKIDGKLKISFCSFSFVDKRRSDEFYVLWSWRRVSWLIPDRQLNKISFAAFQISNFYFPNH